MASGPTKPADGLPEAGNALGCDSESAAEHLKRVLQSPPFARSPRMRRLLAFLVEETLAGRSSQLKEYTIAVVVFERPPEFEPSTSAVVRVEAVRLRKLLMEYAVAHGADDPLVLEIPKGSYVPRFRKRPQRTEDFSDGAAPVPNSDLPPELSEHQVPGSSAPGWSPPAEHRHITVLSCALGDASGAIHGAAGESLLTSFDAFHETCRTVALRHGGLIDGIASDRVIIFFGWPNALEDAAGRALTAAMDLLAEAQPPLSGSGYGIRIGVSTSEVITRGNHAESGSARAGVVGEAPARATAIVQQAPLNGILVAEATRRLMGGAFELIPAGQIESFGEARELIWRVLKPKLQFTRYRASHGGPQKTLIGRREEAALLLRRWELAREGEGQAVVVAGEAGIGKSKLVESVIEQIASEGSVVRLQCSPHHANSTLYPLVGLIRSQIALLGTAQDTVERQLADFRRHFDLDQPLDSALLNSLLLRADDEALRSVSASQRKDLTLRLLTRIFRAKASREPTALLIEDVHWADPTTLELLPDLLRVAAGTRLLVLLTSRQELDAVCLRQTNLTSVRLARLSKHESNELIDMLVSDTRLPADARTQILGKAEGIPLFLEELTKLVLGADEWRVRSSPIPESLIGLLASQLDRLGPTRNVAQLASIIGREFTAGTLALAAASSIREIDTALDQLVAAGVMVRRGSEDSDVFSFRHALLRDAAYESMLEQTRRELHLRVATLLVESFPQVAAEHPELIGRHLSDAGRPDQAIPYWIEAGRKAAARYALSEAIADFRLGLEALGALPALPDRGRRELEILTELGRSIRNARGYVDCELLEIYERAYSLANDLADPLQLSNAVYGLWTHAAGTGKWKQASVLANEFEKLSRAVGDSQLELEAFRLLGASAAFMGDFVTARRHFERVLARYDPDRHGPVYGFDPGAVAAAYLAWTAWHLGDCADADRYAERALAIADAKGHPPTLALVLSWLIFYQVCTRNVDGILEYNRRLQTVCAERECRYWQPLGSACAEWAAFQRDGSASHLEPLLASGSQFQERYLTSCLLLLAADLCLALGRLDHGLEIVAAAARFVEEHDERVWQAECSRYEAELVVRRTPTDLGRATDLLNQALQVARAQGSRQLETRALKSLQRLAS